MKSLLFSLCAITPLLLRAEETINMFENVKEDCVCENFEVFQDSDDSCHSIVLETQAIHLETFNLADAQVQQAPQAGSPSKDKMCPDATMCKPDIKPHQINVRHTESGGIGYNKGYTTLEALFTLAGDKYIPFLDLRGHVFDNGRLAANAGIGARYVLDPSKSMVGINTFYDYRNLKHAHFNQWGLGLEGFYDRWEVRINGYLPFGKKKIVSDHRLNGISFKRFQGNNLWINENYTDKMVSAKKGGDLEIGVHPFKIMRDYDCLIAAGPYYFDGEGKSGWGGKVRLKVEVGKYFFVELSDSYDKVFHNHFQGTVMLSFPFGRKKCYPKKSRGAATNDCFADNIMAWRGVQPVQRQEIIVAKKQTKSYVIDPIAINPVTDQPILITFVKNNAGSPGDGTFENPYNTLANAQANATAGETIYVFAGDGTATGYTLATSWMLQDNQRFLGSAAPHDFQTTKGVVTVPLQTNIFPLITISTANTIIFSTPVPTTHTEISGISVLQHSGSSAIITAQNLIMKNNLFIGDATVHINVQVNSWGKALIDGNTFTNVKEAALFFTKSSLVAPDATVNATISNNIFTKNGIGIRVGPEDTHAAGTLNLRVTGNAISDAALSFLGYGLFVLNNAPVAMNVTINSNSVFNSAAGGILIQQVVAGTAYYQIFDNAIVNAGSSLGNVIFAAQIPEAYLCVNLHDNVSLLNTGGGFGYDFASGGGGLIFTEPFVNDIGTFRGTFTPVPPCFCKSCPLPNND